tara:strand:- start:686 stop:1180 length:495 start_codon:yes stop_codon:yes gene_type:complete
MTDALSYVQSLECNVEREYETCFICEKSCPKSWIIINNDGILKDTPTTKYPSELHYCSNRCYNYRRDMLPSDAWNYLKNKSDFNEPRPVLPTKAKEFQILTFQEIKNLSEDERIDYYNTLEEFTSYNSLSSVHHEEYQEDLRTFELENELDDYYSDENEYDERY